MNKTFEFKKHRKNLKQRIEIYTNRAHKAIDGYGIDFPVFRAAMCAEILLARFKRTCFVLGWLLAFSLIYITRNCS